MTIQEIQRALQEKFPKLTFSLYGGTRIISRVYNGVKKVRFDVIFELDGQFLKINYCFGKINSDYEVLFFTNKFNIKTAPCFKATIERVSSTKEDYLIIKYFQPIAKAEYVPNIFFNSNKALLDNPEFEMLYKRIMDDGLSKMMN